MNKKVHVLYLTSWYPTRVLPTNGDFIERHARAASEFCQLGLIHLAYAPGLTANYETCVDTSKGFVEQLHYLRLPIIAKPFKSLIFIIQYIRAFKAYCAKYGKPHIIHVNVMYPVVLIAYILNLLYKIPYVITEHWTGYINNPTQNLSPLKRWYVRFFSKRNSRVMPVSYHLQKHLESFGLKGCFTVIPNVADTNLFYPGVGKNQTPVRILHVSHLKDEHKNISGIIRVFAKVCASQPETIILQIASETDPIKVLALAQELGVRERIEFLGYKNRLQLAETMRQASYLLLFSNYENLPCVIVEAMASSLPVITSNVGGIPEHISDKNGILVEAGQEQQLFDAIIRMNATFNSYNSSELHAYAHQHFSYQAVGKQLADIYFQEAKV